jgi:crotonobetainyl-CoA:carnitine CoA-transferase CaiB-like acyl-CoA transferase
VVGNPIKTVGEEQPALQPPPGFGEHTEDTLRAAGYSDDEIADLKASGAV